MMTFGTRGCVGARLTAGLSACHRLHPLDNVWCCSAVGFFFSKYFFYKLHPIYIMSA